MGQCGRVPGQRGVVTIYRRQGVRGGTALIYITDPTQKEYRRVFTTEGTWWVLGPSHPDRLNLFRTPDAHEDGRRTPPGPWLNSELFLDPEVHSNDRLG